VTLSLVLGNAALVLGTMTVLWLYSVARRDASVVDPWWSILFLLVTARTAWATGPSPAKALLLSCVALWSLRLAIHLGIRCRQAPAEDPRYRAFRERFGPDRYWWVSFFQVFLLQGILALILSAPLQWAAAAPPPDPVSAFGLAGLALFLAGFFFEAVGDAQLAAHRRDPAKRGTVLATGLWRYTRHPNYFGECLVGWGFWLMAMSRPAGAFLVFAPAGLTFLLLRVSGVSMLEPMLVRSKPGYGEYVLRTPAFFPGRPRSGKAFSDPPGPDTR
jgi:steroid 5-alpha reductase family enzyme